jgi:hypothetical protein
VSVCECVRARVRVVFSWLPVEQREKQKSATTNSPVNQQKQNEEAIIDMDNFLSLSGFYLGQMAER